jgi:hypothetical protein
VERERAAPHPIKGNELRAALEDTASMGEREAVDMMNARGLLTPYGRWWDIVLMKKWRKRLGIKSPGIVLTMAPPPHARPAPPLPDSLAGRQDTGRLCRS